MKERAESRVPQQVEIYEEPLDRLEERVRKAHRTFMKTLAITGGGSLFVRDNQLIFDALKTDMAFGSWAWSFEWTKDVQKRLFGSQDIWQAEGVQKAFEKFQDLLQSRANRIDEENKDDQ